MTDRSLDGATALLTGASAGIGAASARELAAEGANCVLLARSEDDIEALAAELEDDHGVEAVAIPTDVTDYDAVVAAVEATVERFGGLDVVLSNAGVGGESGELLEDTPIEEFRGITEVNVHGMFHVTHATLPHLRDSQGTLVFTGSSSAKLPRPNAPIYAGSKWWTRGFALSVQAHAGQDGVAVTIINPTAVRTGMWPDLDPGEAAEPEEVGRLVALAAAQPGHSTLGEIDLFRRDLLGKFLATDHGIDLDLAYDLE